MLETPPATLDAADIALTTVTPDVPESPTAPAAEPAAEPSGLPRDAQGRFTSPEPTPEPAPAEVAPTEPAPESPAAPPGEPPAPAEEPAEPFTYRADGQEFAIPGSLVGEDGVFIPTPQMPDLERLLASGRAASGSLQTRLTEATVSTQRATKRAEAAEQQLQHVLGHFETLIEKGQLQQWLDGVQQNWPILKAEAKARGLELQQQAERQELEQFREQQRVQQLRPVMDQTLESAVVRYGQPVGLDEAQMAEVYRLLHEPRYESLVFVKAPYDDPANGIRQGELVIDYSVVEGAIRLAAAGRKQQQAIAKAVAQNQAVTQPKPVPPTVGGKGTKQPRQGPALPKITSAQEADAFLLEGDLDQFAEAE